MDATEHELISGLALGVVETEAPEELPLFRATSRAYFETPESVLRRVVGRDDTLGFGADIFMALTPFALAAASAVVKFLADQALVVAQDVGHEAAGGILRGWLGRLKHGESTQALPLTAEQLEQVREVAYDKARQLGLADDQADLLADAVGGSLSRSR